MFEFYMCVLNVITVALIGVFIVSSFRAVQPRSRLIKVD